MLSFKFGRIIAYKDIDPARLAWINRYFQSTIFPVLTPLASDLARNISGQIISVDGNVEYI